MTDNLSVPGHPLLLGVNAGMRQGVELGLESNQQQQQCCEMGLKPMQEMGPGTAREYDQWVKEPCGTRQGQEQGQGRCIFTGNSKASCCPQSIYRNTLLNVFTSAATACPLEQHNRTIFQEESFQELHNCGTTCTTGTISPSTVCRELDWVGLSTGKSLSIDQPGGFCQMFLPMLKCSNAHCFQHGFYNPSHHSILPEAVA